MHLPTQFDISLHSLGVRATAEVGRSELDTAEDAELGAAVRRIYEHAAAGEADAGEKTVGVSVSVELTHPR